MAFALPPPSSDLASPANAPTAPGDVISATFSGSTTSGAPVISAWNVTVFPDESFTLTGSGFTSYTGEDEGKDTIVWIGGLSGINYDVTKCIVWNVTSQVLTATVPSSFTNGMFLIWVENSIGVSYPIALNKTAAQWIGPKGNIVAAGETIRIFGRNVSRSHASSQSFVYAKLTANSVYSALTVTAVNPFSITCTAPGSVGTYDILVHNGHGGQYGWSEVLALTVEVPWTRDTFSTSVSPSGTNDTTAIRNALDTVGARTNGGTVQLSSGTYIVTDEILIPTKARLRGAGIDSTKLEIRFADTSTNRHTAVMITGNRIAIEDIELRFILTNVAPQYAIVGTWINTLSENLLRNLRIKADPNTFAALGVDMAFRFSRSEIDHVETWKEFFLYDSSDVWVHDSTFYGDLKPTGAEGGITVSGDSRIVYEFCHTETPNWQTTIPDGDNLARRVMSGHANAGGIRNFYIANNTSKDTYPPFYGDDMNKGEIILFHVHGGYVRQVASHSGMTTTIRSDDLIDGTSYTQMPSVTMLSSGNLGDVAGDKVKIVGGKGIGQIRDIASNTTLSVTVSKAWRIEPDSTSKLIIDSGYSDIIIYNNNLTGLPSGYVPPSGAISASNYVQLDGNSWNNVVELNTAVRVETGGAVMASYATQSYWNEFRSNTSSSRNWGTVISFYEYGLTCGSVAQGPGAALLGNAIRKNSTTVTGPIYDFNEYDRPASLGDHAQNYWSCFPIVPSAFIGNIFEGGTVYGKERAVKIGEYSDSLVRNNIISVSSSPSGLDFNIINPNEAILWRTNSSRARIIGNSYTLLDSSVKYAGALQSRLTIPNRVLFISVTVNRTAFGSFSVYNAGTASSSWTATSQSAWISVSSVNTTLQPETDTGIINITVNASALSVGNYTGSIRVVMGADAQIATVRLTVLAEPVGKAYETVSRSDVPNLAGTGGLQTLLLRIRDHQRHIYEKLREIRPDVAAVYPSVIQICNDKGTREFTIYDVLKFTHTGAGLTEQGNVNDVCDAHQIHPHMRQWHIPNPWTSTVPTDTVITPYHYWKACDEVRAWRVANGALPDNTRPLLATEVGIDYLAQNGSGRVDLFQLRRLKYGMLSLGCLYYGCSLVNFYAAGRSAATSYNVIDPNASTAGQVSFVGAGAVAASSGTATLSPALPSGTQTGDLLICFAYSRSADGSHTSPWTNHTTIDVTPHFLTVSYKISAGAGVDVSPTITPSGVLASQGNIASIVAFRGVDQTTPFGTPGANVTNTTGEDVGPIPAATALVTNGAVIVAAARNTASAGNVANVLSGDGISWAEAVDGGQASGDGCHMIVDYGTWTSAVPTLTAKTIDITGGVGAGCGKMLLLRPGTTSTGGFFGSDGERDADYAFQALDAREPNDNIPFDAKTWKDYWKGWQVACDVSQDPIDGDSSVCPFTEWNRVTMSGGTVSMAAGSRNVVARKKNLRRGLHTFSCELKLSANAKACLRVSGHDKLNGLALVSSTVLTGAVDWTSVSVQFTPRQHNNPRVPDPRVCVLMIDHDGTGTCDARNPAIAFGGSVTPEVPPPTPDFFDLQVTDITWSPATPLAGEAVTFSATIINNGNVPTPDGVIHGISFTIAGAQVSYSDNVTTSLAAKAQRTQTANGGPSGVATWTAVAGTHSVGATVDDANRFTAESDKTNNSLVESIVIASPPSGTITAPPPASGAGLHTLFFNDEFTSLDFYHAVNSPNGKWRFNEQWQPPHLAGYIDFAGLRTFMINQMSTGDGGDATSDKKSVETIKPYLPASQLDSTTMRLTCRRSRLSERPALRALVNDIAVNGQGQNADQATWLGAFMTTEIKHPYSVTDINRPAYMEIRMRFTPANIKGIFASFWIYNTSEGTGSPEIDIFETNDGTYEKWKTNITHTADGPAWHLEHTTPWDDGNFHIIGMLWEASSLRVYHDNVLGVSLTGANADFFSMPMRIILTHTCDAHYFEPYGLLIPSNIEQVYWDIDYIRVWRPGTAPPVDPPPTNSNAKVFPANGTLATGYTVTAGGLDSPVYPVTINKWYRENPNTRPSGTEQEQWDTMEANNETAGFTSFEMLNTTAVSVAVKFNDRTVTSAKVYPVRHGITPTITGGNTVNFSVPKRGKYIVMINGTEVRPCHIFAYPVDTTAPTASGTGVVYYGPGTHDIGTITIANDTTYYIAGGARVVGNFNCGGKTGWKIKGRGIAQSSSQFLLGSGASNFTVEGITVVRPLNNAGGWTFDQRACNTFTVEGVNVFTCDITRDGIDTMCSHDYTLRDCFCRVMDDPCCINAVEPEGSIYNVTIEDCVFMADSAIGVTEIGASIECEYVRDVTYRRIDAINSRSQAGISIFNSDYGDVNNIVYDDIQFDNFIGSVGVGSCWLAMFLAKSSGFTAPEGYQPGKIRNIDLYNVSFFNTPTNICKMRYCGNSTYTVGEIRWHNLKVNGTVITDPSQLTSVNNEAYVGSVTYDTKTSDTQSPGVLPMVTNRAHMANGALSSGDVRNPVWRTAFWTTTGGTVTQMRLVFSNTYLTSTTENNGPNTIYISAAIEYGTTNWPVYFNGVREVTVAAGATVTSDAVTVSIPANTQFWTRQIPRTANATEKYPMGYNTRSGFGEGFSTTTPSTQLDATGVLSGNTQSGTFGPVAILGASSSTAGTATLIGSSSTFSSNEDYNSAPVPGDRGYLAHRLSNVICHNVLACGGLWLSNFISTSTRRMAILAACKPKYVVNQLGANDIIGDTAAATVKSNLQTLWNTLSQAGYSVIQQTYTPTATSSTGSWTTVNEQTPTHQTIRNDVNAFIRTVPSPLSGILDVCAVVESSAGSGRWRVDGGAWTNDGTHAIKHVEIAAALSLSPFGINTGSPEGPLEKRGLTMNMDADFSGGASGGWWDTAISHMNTLGIDFSRETLYNCGTFATGSTTFSPYAAPWMDNLKTKLVAAGKGAVLELQFIDADNGNPDNYGPNHRLRVASFSRWAATRYGDWALWFMGRNEPDIQTNWINQGMDAISDRIVAEQKAVYDAVKAVNPNIFVEGPPMTTHPYNYNTTDSNFHRSATISYKILERGITRYMDGYGFHSSTTETEDYNADGVYRVTYPGEAWKSQRTASYANGYPFVPMRNTEWNSPYAAKPTEYSSMSAEQWQSEVHHAKWIMFHYAGLDTNIQYCFSRSAAGVDFGIANSDGTTREPVYSRTRDYIRPSKYKISVFNGSFNRQVSLNGWNKTWPWWVLWEVLYPTGGATSGLPRQWARVTWNTTGGTNLGYTTDDYAAVAAGGFTALRQLVTGLKTDGTQYRINARAKLTSNGTARLRGAGHNRLPIAAGSEFVDHSTTTVNSVVALTVTVTPTNPWVVISLETLTGAAHWHGVTIAAV